MNGDLKKRWEDEMERNLKKEEMRDEEKMDEGEVIIKELINIILEREIVEILLNVDEVKEDKERKVEKEKMERKLLGWLKIGMKRGVINRMLEGREERIEVDGKKGLSMVDDEVEERFESKMRKKNKVKMRLKEVESEDRNMIEVRMEEIRMDRNENKNEIIGIEIEVIEGKEYLSDVIVVNIKDREIDEDELLIEERGRCRLKSKSEKVLKKENKILIVEIELRIGEVWEWSEKDKKNEMRKLELIKDIFKEIEVMRIGDIERNEEKERGVGNK